MGAGTPGGIAAIAVAPRLEAPQPLLTALDRLIPTADLPTLRALSDALPRYSLLLSPITVRIAAALVDLHRVATETDRDIHLPDLAMSMNNLAIRLAEAGRRAEGLAAAQEAVERYRELGGWCRT
ncbi:MAG: hypothetical protein DLM62_16195, partial [Pseudonocardiales bacterium]